MAIIFPNKYRRGRRIARKPIVPGRTEGGPSKYLDLLEAINNGQNLRVPSVSNSIAVAAPVQHFSPVIQISSATGTKDANQDLAERMERKLRDMFTEMYSRETIRNMRHGGLLSK